MTSCHPLLARSCGLFLIATLAACSFVEDPMAKAMSKMTPYRIEVVQGNFVSKEQLQALRPGMTRRQVKEILGTPLIASVFHANRWDYAFTIKRQGTAPQQRKLSVFFKDDVFEHVESEDLPSEAEFAEKLTSNRAENIKVPELKASEQDLEKFRKSSPPAAVEAPADAAGPAKTYPPLEPKTP
jgi:outer membrane protein assembly factor BamE